MKTADYWIQKLRLEKHPEGGHFRETYRSRTEIGKCCLGDGFAGRRSVSTAIYFLLRGDEFSALHRIGSDELWHHYAGASLAIHLIDPAGQYRKLLLGENADAGEQMQGVVPARCWFGANLHDSSAYALVGCTVAPGFDFQDFEMGKREELLRQYPQHTEIIRALTR